MMYSRLILIVLTMALTSCSTTKPLKDTESLSIKELGERGIVYLKNGEYEKSRIFFSQALKREPKNCQLHFLNALSYQLQGKSGNKRLFDMAASGLRNAIRFCPQDPWPYYYLGLIEFQEKNFNRSKMLFFQAMKLDQSPESVAILSAFIKSAQRSGDYDSVDQIISLLRKLSPSSPMLKELENIRDNIPQTRKVPGKQRILNSTSKFGSPKSQKIKKDRKQVFIDAVMIISQETQNRNRGVNLLNGLQLQYGNNIEINRFGTNNFLKYANAASSAGFDLSTVALPSLEYSTAITHTISIPDITYNLNIFNDVNESDRVLSRPTLLARDGKTSTYFAGNRLIVGVSGLNTGQIESIPIGVTMKITPSFQKDGSIDLDIEFGKELILPQAASSTQTNIDQVAITAKDDTNTSVNVNFGETVVLSAFTEGVTADNDDRTPGLGDLPLVRYLFGRKTAQKRNTSIIVLLTPRKAISFENQEDHESITANIQDYYNRFTDPVSNLNFLLTRLSKNNIYRAFDNYYEDLYSEAVIARAIDYTSKNIVEY